MTIQTINTGSGANSRDGDSIRAAFTKVNNNFVEVLSALNTMTGSSGTSLVNVSGVPPQYATTGTLWYDEFSGKIFVYYDSFWVDANPTDPMAGYVGSRGVPGYAGSTGYTGSASTASGYTGSKGVGYTGSQGTNGNNGFTGSQGAPGAAAWIGYTGSKGDLGYTGSASNVIGYTGSTGDIGYTGSQGIGKEYDQDLNTFNDVTVASLNVTTGTVVNRTLSVGGHPLDSTGNVGLLDNLTSPSLLVSNYDTNYSTPLIQVRGYGQNILGGTTSSSARPGIHIEVSRGTPISPLPVGEGDLLFKLQGGGYDGNRWSSETDLAPVTISGYSAENWAGSATTTTNIGAALVIRVQPPGIEMNFTSRYLTHAQSWTTGSIYTPPILNIVEGNGSDAFSLLTMADGVTLHWGHGRTNKSDINVKHTVVGVPFEDSTTFNADFSGTTMTVNSVSSGVLSIGQRIYGPGTGLTDGTFINSQTSGSTGTTGVYLISVAHPTNDTGVTVTAGPDNITLADTNLLYFSTGRKNGTSGRRNAVRINDSLGGIFMLAQTTNNSSSTGNTAGSYRIFAKENWTPSTRGTYALIKTVKSGSTTQIESLRLDSDNNIQRGIQHTFQSSTGVNQLTVSSTTVTSYSSILPSADSIYDLGDTSTQWRSIYVSTGSIYIGGHSLNVNPVGELTLDGNGISGVILTGDTPPLTPSDGTTWYDSNSGRLYIYFDSAWVDASPAGGSSYRPLTPYQVISPPASSTSTGIAGQVASDATYMFICVNTNTWVRSALVGGW